MLLLSCVVRYTELRMSALLKKENDDDDVDDDDDDYYYDDDESVNENRRFLSFVELCIPSIMLYTVRLSGSSH